jgi:probable HAF family extracellular repeat protein
MPILPPLHFIFDVTGFDYPTAAASFGTEIRNSNILGDFVGRYSSTAGPGFTGQSFVSIGGVMSDLTFAEATDGVSAMDINDSGQIAGIYLAAGDLHGFVYDGGSVTTIDKAGADPFSLQILGMNNIGQVVGTYAAAGAQHAFVWSSGSGFTDLDLSGSGVGSSSILALDINDSGQIVGTYEDASSIDHGFLLGGNGQFATIAFPDAVGPGSGAVSINNAGQIAGFYLGSDNHVHPFVYSSGIYSTVDMPNSGGAYGISNNGTVAGSDNDGTTHHGFLAEISGATSAINKAVWLPGADGNFDDAGKWKSGSVPDAASIVLITRQTDFTVTMDTDHTIYKLRVGTANFDEAKLAIHDATLEITGGVIDVPGTLTLDSFTGHGASLLISKSTIILGGCGCEPDIAMGLSGNAGPISIGTAADATSGVRLLNDGAYIAGQGQIGDARMQLGNGGQIEAQGGTLTLDTGANKIFNAGELDATPGATLDVESSLDNYGLILAAGNPVEGDATVNLNAGLNNYSLLDAASYGNINIDGAVKNYGGMYSEGNLTISGNVFNTPGGGFIADGGSIDITGTVTNGGTMVAADGSISVHGMIKNAGQLISDSGLILIDDDVLGGSASIVDDGAIDFGGRSNTAVDFSGSQGGNLIIDDARHFVGDISGFDDTDMITLSNLLIGATTRLSFDAGSGVLRVVDHGTVAAKLNFDGSYTSSDFTLTHDTNNHVVIQHTL